jgi:decaprenyl-phosphate phosphoribosyltransferase
MSRAVGDPNVEGGDQGGRSPDVVHQRQHPRNIAEVERALLALDRVQAVTVTEQPFPHVEAIYVEAPPGVSVADTIEDVIGAARDSAGVDLVSERVHVLPSETTPPSPRRRIGLILATARPRQWVKNLLVYGAPATGGVLLEPAALLSATLAFVSFCLVASGIYSINDVVDAVTDRQHPVKRLRPAASRLLSSRQGVTLGAGLTFAGLVVALVGGGPSLLGVAGGYVALALAYTFFLRRIALLDLAAIAGGFLLRAVAGGVVTGVALSNWFLIVASFGSLFLAAGKRHAEYVHLGAERANHRATLGEYSESFLRYIQYSSSTIAIAGYTLWAFEGSAGGTVWSGLSIIPFVLAIFRYGLLLEQGRGAAPEDAVLKDLPLLILGASWVLLVAIGVYLR